MTKQEFLSSLRLRLKDLPKDELEERLTFYTEMIDDRTEEGLSEDEAIAEIGSIDEIVEQINADVVPRVQSKKGASKRATILLAVSSPLWIALLSAAFAIVFSVFVSIWAVVASIWALFASFAISAPAALVLGFGYAFGGNVLTGVAMLGIGSVLAGLAIFLFFGCKALTRLSIILTKKAVLLIKAGFKKSEGI